MMANGSSSHLPSRSQSECHDQNFNLDFSSDSNVRRLCSEPKTFSPCISPSLRTIRKNVVKTRRQEFERLSQVNEASNMSQNVPGNNSTCSRLVKSDGCINRVGVSRRLVRGPSDDETGCTQPKFRVEGTLNLRSRQLILEQSLSSSSSFIPSDSVRGAIGNGENGFYQKDIPPFKLKANSRSTQQQNNRNGGSSLDIPDNIKFQNESPNSSAGENEVFYEPCMKDTNSGPESIKPKLGNLETTSPEGGLISRASAGAAAVQIPPPKPPRILSKVFSDSDQEHPQCLKTTDSQCDDHKTDTELTAQPQTVSPKDVTPDKNLIMKIKARVHVYEEIDERAVTEMSVKAKKQRELEWGLKFFRAPVSNSRKKENKTVCVNNPNYTYGSAKATEDITVGRPLVRFSSDYALYQEGTSHRQKAGNMQRLNYDEPCKVQEEFYDEPLNVNKQIYRKLHRETEEIDDEPCNVKEEIYSEPISVTEPVNDDVFEMTGIGSGQSDTRGRVVAQLDEQGGHAVPEEGTNTTSKQQAQLKAKSKVSHAYAFLRLPTNAGEKAQIDDIDTSQEEHERRLHHVKSVRLRTRAAIAKYEQVKLKSTSRLFQYGMIIGLEDDAENGGVLKPKIKFCIPSEMQEGDSFVGTFCFPDADIWEPQTDYEGELFSFVLTSATGDRRYGWCKRYLPPGSGPRLPEALCIISTLGEFGMYEQLLRTIEESRCHSIECATELFEVAYARPMPAHNKEVYIRTLDPDNTRRTIILKRAAEFNRNTVAFACLLNHLQVPVLIQVFGALLLERKIIFCAAKLNTLSSCISAVVALLYPFEWQHTYITVLPSSLIDIVEAPTPFILGILTSMKSSLEDHEMSEVLVIDLDAGSIVSGIGDESGIIPKKIQKALTSALTDDGDAAVVTSGSGTLYMDKGGINDVTVSESFLRMFLETCADYSKFIIRPEKDEATFQRESFVKVASSKSLRLFLDWFTQTQMFEVFISDRLNQNAAPGLFDKRIAEYQTEMEPYLNKGRRKKKKVPTATLR